MVYTDSSVLLRFVFRERGALPDRRALAGGVTSALTEVECHRALDRERLRARAGPQEIALRHEDLRALLDGLDVVEVDRVVLVRASAPFSTPLRTLDAIHLATALLVQEAREVEMTMATHDVELATAARAHGLAVLGA